MSLGIPMILIRGLFVATSATHDTSLFIHSTSSYADDAKREKKKSEIAFSTQPTEHITRPGNDDPIIDVKHLHRWIFHRIPNIVGVHGIVRESVR